MYPLRSRFRYAVQRMHFFSAHPDLDNAGIILHQLAHGFPSQSPHTRKFANPVMLLEGCVIDRHGKSQVTEGMTSGR